MARKKSEEVPGFFINERHQFITEMAKEAYMQIVRVNGPIRVPSTLQSLVDNARDIFDAAGKA